MSYDMYVPTRVLFGAGRLSELHSQAMPGKKAMVVISNGKSTRASGCLDRTLEQLRMAGAAYAVFDRVEPNPLNGTVSAGAEFARQEGCDFIVALGGGSVMDAAKAMAVLVTNGGDFWDYIPTGTGKGLPVTQKPLPLVAITTTAGTGSETDMACVVTNPDTVEKTSLKIEGNFPVLAIVDPELMRTVPPRFTAFQGFDALSHSLEGYISSRANLMSDMYALTAVENIARWLPAAIRNGDDLEAREHVAFGNTLSGLVMCVGALTSHHSLEHALSAYHQDLPHGAGLILLSRAYFTHVIERHVCDERFVRLARAMGKTDAREPMDFIAALDAFLRACGVGELKMSDYGITPDEFPQMVQNAKSAMAGLFRFDRAPLSDGDCLEIYERSYT